MSKGNFRDTYSPGEVFNHWTVLKKGESTRTPSGQKKVYWVCKCDCGVEKQVYGNSLSSGKSKSCGCTRSNRRGYGDASRTNVYSEYRSRARRKGLEFTITEVQFNVLTLKDCDYCGDPPSNRHDNPKMNGGHTYNGLDRVDNKQGYILSNVVPCCKDCNLAKRSLGRDVFLKLVKRIYERHWCWTYG